MSKPVVALVAEYRRANDTRARGPPREGEEDDDATVRQMILNDAKSLLPERQYRILAARLALGTHQQESLRQVGASTLTGLSAERVRQIEETACNRLLHYVRQQQSRGRGCDDLASFLEAFENDYPLDDLGKYGSQMLAQDLTELGREYGEHLARKVERALRRAYITRDFYSGRLSEKMKMLEELGLPVRVANVLRHLGVRRAGDIAQLAAESIRCRGYVGDKSIAELSRKLGSMGLRLRG